MRKRNIALLFRLNRKEAELLNKKVKKSGLSREAYLRHLVNGLLPNDAPPPDYYAMMQEL
ncbi:plasmid mobilization relaxosome protein MobC, partial [Anaerovorax odorimutans]|nr:plasmid mobilization relaxosome protein MobC [Anaerovorax odorimutans]